MNRIFLSSLLSLAFLPMAGASPLSLWQNNSRVTDPAAIPTSVQTIINRGSIEIATSQPFETFDTLNVTNQAGTSSFSGLMSGTPGFRFSYNPSAGGDRRMMANFFSDNNSRVEATDAVLGFDSFIPFAMVGHSQLRIWSTNITVRSGTPVGGSGFTRASLITGANGLLDIWGKNVDLTRSGLEVLPVWNESQGSVNDFDNGIFYPDLAIHDIDGKAIIGNFGPGNQRLNSVALWDGASASSMNAPPVGTTVVPAFTLTNPEADYYITGDPEQIGFVNLTNYIPSFTTANNNFISTLTNRVTITNVIVTLASDFLSSNGITYLTNLLVPIYSTNFQVANGFDVVNVASVTTNFYTVTNIFVPTNSTDVTSVFLSTNTFVFGDIFGYRTVSIPVKIYTNMVKGAFFGEAPSGFVITHGFAGGNEPRTIFATISVGISNAVTGFADVASIAVQDTLASDATTRVVLPNYLTTFLAPQAPTSRPGNYLVSRGGTFSFSLSGTNIVTGLTNITGTSINLPPPADFFYSYGITDVNSPFYDTNTTTSSDLVAARDRLVAAGTYSGYQAFIDNVVERPDPSPVSNVTNWTGQVVINADRLNLDRTRIRGEGFVRIETPHLISSTNAVIDCENLALDLGNTNGTLRIMNLVPDSVTRLRGNITVWSAVWSNSVTVLFTNNFVLTNGSTVFVNPANTNDVRTNVVVTQTIITNTYGVLYHTMMLDARSLSSVFPVTVHDLATRSPNVIIDDNLSVAHTLFVSGKSFTLNGILDIPGSLPLNPYTRVPSEMPALQDWRGTNAPNLAFFTNNGTLVVPGEAHFGDDRQSPYSAFVNNGLIQAYSLHLNSMYFENPGRLAVGTYTLTNFNNTFDLGATLEMRGSSGILAGGQSLSGGDTLFFCRELTLSNYFIHAEGAVNINVTNRLADGGVQGPSVIEVFNGFNLQMKPQSGDLLGTTFVSMAPDVPAAYPFHTWAAEDRGPSAAGFSNNAAINSLILFPSISADLSPGDFDGAFLADALYFQADPVSSYLWSQLSINSIVAIFQYEFFGDTNVLNDTLVTDLNTIIDGPVIYDPTVFAEVTLRPQTQAVLARRAPVSVLNRLLLEDTYPTAIAQLSSIPAGDPRYVFQGVGTHNAMYVDLLDLSYLSDITNQLYIDPSLTIYFAAASLGFTPPDATNGVPQTPEEFLNGLFGGRLRWVSDFAGPNSSTTVTIDGQSVVVNSGLANQWSNNGVDPSTVLHLAPITIEINGNGVVSPYTNAQNLIIGQTNTIVAIPNSGATFLGWTGTYESSSPQLTFVADNDVVLIANFSFTPIAASYNGLFYTTNAVEFLKSGAISITTTKGGKYSGSVQYGAKKYSFTGILDEAGADGRSIPNSPLFLEFQTGTDHVTGTIGDGDWLADLYLDRAVYNAKTNPAPFQGHYTLLFPGSGSVTNTELPFGDGYGTVTVDAAGKVRLTGSLADGTKISQSSVVSGDRHWPLYIPLYKGQGQLLSWQSVLDTGDKDIGGDYSWIKPPDDRSKVYSGGFAFQTNAFGSFYNSALSPLTGFEDALVILSGGDLMTNLQTGVFVTNKVYAVGTNKFTMTLSIPTGTFKGVTLNPATGKPINFTGAVLQKQGYGSGYFLGTNQTSGKVTVIPTP